MGWVLFFSFYFPLVMETGMWGGGCSKILQPQRQKGHQRPSRWEAEATGALDTRSRASPPDSFPANPRAGVCERPGAQVFASFC